MSIGNYMGKKSYHPGSFSNQKRVFDAEQAREAERRRVAEREAELRQERRALDDQLDDLRRRGHSRDAVEMERARRQVAFLYDVPRDVRESEHKREEGEDGEDGEDARRQGAREERRRRPNMEEKFPFLKYAPRTDRASDPDALCYKPLGVMLQNVQCIRCKQWGHRTGDKACPMARDLTANDEAALAREDPLQQMGISTTLTGQRATYHLKYATGDVGERRGREHGTSTLNAMVESDDETERLEAEHWLAGLSKREKKKLLRAARKREREKRREEKRERKRDRKRKRSRSPAQDGSRSPPRRRRRSGSRSPPRRRRRSGSRSPSRRHRSGSPSHHRRRSDSRSPSRRHRGGSRSPSRRHSHHHTHRH